MTLSIAGKTAIVTGSARGIGLAIARHFVDLGANVMFADIDEARLESELGEEAEGEGPLRYFAGDLSQKLTAANLLSATVDAFDRIDILVNANRDFATTDPLNPDDPAFEMLIRQNMLCAVRLSQMVARRMIAQAERNGQEEGQVGAIVNVTTLAARLAQPELLGVSVASAAMEQATRSLAVALAPHRIRVNGVAFASVLSASLQSALRENGGWRDRIIDATPLGRIAAPTEIAEAALYLASEASGFVTGQILTLDGGRGLIDPAGVPAY
ncbi:SDR family NAD(P)-dependent oxidoreductase [Albidovulum sediminis]|uniref:SDR family oxidoreductase n=1 Tax=Albidovulum sediminis TaxID=3066345 RepID=A0ABT2NR89_9RHOB|nr:SDR family oxidoreductase [Defluviimonas sediminis]MCT8331458.1 SDR family oxidoreductase [Defluviimonas sediminis]